MRCQANAMYRTTQELQNTCCENFRHKIRFDLALRQNKLLLSCPIAQTARENVGSSYQQHNLSMLVSYTTCYKGAMCSIIVTLGAIICSGRRPVSGVHQKGGTVNAASLVGFLHKPMQALHGMPTVGTW